MNQEIKNCQNCKKDFVIESEDFQFYEKMKVPAPTWCPMCRLQRRLTFMFERSLYKRPCALCGKACVSNFSPDKKVITYCSECWWSDKWDPMDYGVDYDPSRPFLEQVRELAEKTPYCTIQQDYLTLVNSDYTAYIGHAKNCYLITIADFCDNVMYSHILANVKDSSDCTMTGESELCYGDVNVGGSYNTYFSEDSNNCYNCYFVKDCIGCNNCFGCINLRNKKYYIFNRQYTKEEYEEKIKDFNLNTYSGLQKAEKEAHAFWLTQPHKYMHERMNSSVTGDYVYNSKNVRDGYQMRGAEDCRYVSFLTLPPTKDSYDYTEWGNNASRIYECTAVGEYVDNIKFCVDVWGHCRDVEYSMTCGSCANLFGCSKLRKKQYCILNKQYTKEEYEKLRAQIISDMNTNPYRDEQGRVYKYGEFFPSSFSPSCYNETDAMDYFPLSKIDAIKLVGSWHENEPSPHVPTIKAKDLPDKIEDVPDFMLKEIIECATCHNAFRIITPELDLFRRFNLPLPRNCHNCRYKERLSRINPVLLWDRQCAKCKKDIKTSYSPDRPEIIYCETCYNAEVA
jgi:hypothetical protein